MTNDTITLTQEQLQSIIAQGIAQALAKAAVPAPAPEAVAAAPIIAQEAGPDAAALLRDIVKATAGFEDIAGRTLANPDKTWARRLTGRVSKAGKPYGGFLPLLDRASALLHHKTAGSLVAKAKAAGDARDASALAAVGIAVGKAILTRSDDANALAAAAQARCTSWTDAHSKALATMIG